jgi:hypothetical protein
MPDVSYAAGLIGYCEDDKISINNCYSTGIVTVEGKATFAGGLIAGKGSNINLENSYHSSRYIHGDTSRSIGEYKNAAPSSSSPEPSSSPLPEPSPSPETPNLGGVSDWARESIARAIETGIVPSQVQSNFTADITRAEFCALAVAIYETYTGKEIVERKTFADTTDINVEKAAGAGLVGGGGDGFNPEGVFNRQMAAVLVVNILSAMDIDLPKAEATFGDSDLIASWASVQIGQAQAAGLVSGSGGSYSPQGKFTRQAGILLMLNLWDYLAQ